MKTGWRRCLLQRRDAIFQILGSRIVLKWGAFLAADRQSCGGGQSASASDASFGFALSLRICNTSGPPHGDNEYAAQSEYVFGPGC